MKIAALFTCLPTALLTLSQRFEKQDFVNQKGIFQYYVIRSEYCFSLNAVHFDSDNVSCWIIIDYYSQL